MLPAAAAFHFPWEVNSGAVQEGESVRVFGRWVLFQIIICLDALMKKKYDLYFATSLFGTSPYLRYGG